jgi:sugar phosphate isomerase/epimerase
MNGTIGRREFLGVTTPSMLALPVALSVGSEQPQPGGDESAASTQEGNAAAKGNSSSGIRIGMSLYTYDSDIWVGLMNVKEAIDHASGLGVEGIELVDKMHIPNYPHPSPYDLMDLRDYVKSRGMQIACYSYYIDEHLYPDRVETTEERIRQVRAGLANASILGAPVVRVAGRPEPLIACSAFAKQLGIKLGFELHAPMPARKIIDGMKAAGALEHLGLIPDFGCWAPRPNGNPTIDDFKYALPYTIHIHAKALGFDKNGEEVTIPYPSLLAALKEAQPNCFIVAEFEGYLERDYRGRAKEMAEIHLKLLRKYLQ